MGNSATHQRRATRFNIAPTTTTDADSDAALTPFYTHSTSSKAVLERTPFELALSKLDAAIIRAKGVVYFSDNPEQAYVWQRVGNHQTLTKKSGLNAAKTNTDLTKESHIVLIATAPISQTVKNMLSASIQHSQTTSC